MIIVLDASAGIEIVLNRGKAGVFNTHLLRAGRVISSDLYKAETANVIWKYVKANLLSAENINRTLELCQNLVDEYVDISENNEEAISEAIRLNHSTYDLLYLTLARRNGALLMTVDNKLNALAESNGVKVLKE